MARWRNRSPLNILSILSNCTFAAIFLENGLTFTPFKIKANLSDKQSLPLKGFRCGQVAWSLNEMRSAQPIEIPTKIMKDDCYLVFLDYRALIDEQIEMDINAALRLNDRIMNIPTIRFIRNPAYKQ